MNLDNFLKAHPTYPFFVIVTLLTLCNGIAISFMWNWFVAPLGVPPLSILAAMGIFILVRLLNVHDYDKTMKAEIEAIPVERMPDTMLRSYVLVFKAMVRKPIFALLCGSIVHLLQ